MDGIRRAKQQACIRKIVGIYAMNHRPQADGGVIQRANLELDGRVECATGLGPVHLKNKAKLPQI